MILTPTKKVCLSSALTGLLSSLCFVSGFDVFVMLAFNETGKHPVEYPAIMIVCLISAAALFAAVFLNIRVMFKSDRALRLIAADILVFLLTFAASYFMWAYLLALFDSDAVT